MGLVVGVPNGLYTARLPGGVPGFFVPLYRLPLTVEGCGAKKHGFFVPAFTVVFLTGNSVA